MRTRPTARDDRHDHPWAGSRDRLDYTGFAPAAVPAMLGLRVGRVARSGRRRVRRWLRIGPMRRITAKTFRVVSRRFFTASVVSALFVPGPCAAQAAQTPAQEATTSEGDVQLTRQAAEYGVAVAQYVLGTMYASGRGVAQDDALAAQWYRKAADQGDSRAQHNLALMYTTGRGVPQDDAEAVRWFRRAAEQGVPEAQNNLAAMYARGRGVPRDDVGAVQWYRKAADQGSPQAQHSLGQMYAAGEGVSFDIGEAVRWNRLAAEQGHRSAQNTVGLFYQAGRGVAQDDVEAYKWHELAVLGSTGDRQKEFAEVRDELAKRMNSQQLAEARKRAADWEAAFEKREAE